MRSEGHGTFPERLMVDCSRCSCICTTVGSVYRDFKLKYIGRILETKKDLLVVTSNKKLLVFQVTGNYCCAFVFI